MSPRFDDAEALFSETRDQGYKGVVAKSRTAGHNDLRFVLERPMKEP